MTAAKDRDGRDGDMPNLYTSTLQSGIQDYIVLDSNPLKEPENGG